ncbi:TerB family tellurite resistance protein [Euzebyella marina]|uniref:TerB family tellurite resistance protein n=1 Tax=Euzebyella marina TaxID=1761453 RepID=A0A3G2L917_9FLAO|nr:TerB family tellurite resistance protein [Euzebyella marina]AYN68734.1 TerB family tellurite resistance protein [Euzebyella marina]MAU72182.1 hypothetical protein [Pseudozobellia sp.]MBG48738.1 hypothetical protein [Pseudozobellia sp.]|tara:strand:+ start:1365 stop:1766 length:402 start_codon:yes stop_codon:yes gene_type:complete
MASQKEKLSILSEMIEFAKVDGQIKEPEFNFLKGVADQLGVDRETFNSLFVSEVEHVQPKSQADRILQFHRLVLLMNVDAEQQELEVTKLHNLGLSMGLPPMAIQRVLAVMNDYPGGVVPPKTLIDIFKVHYN